MGSSAAQEEQACAPPVRADILEAAPLLLRIPPQHQLFTCAHATWCVSVSHLPMQHEGSTKVQDLAVPYPGASWRVAWWDPGLFLRQWDTTAWSN